MASRQRSRAKQAKLELSSWTENTRSFCIFSTSCFRFSCKLWLSANPESFKKRGEGLCEPCLLERRPSCMRTKCLFAWNESNAGWIYSINWAIHPTLSPLPTFLPPSSPSLGAEFSHANQSLVLITGFLCKCEWVGWSRRLMKGKGEERRKKRGRKRRSLHRKAEGKLLHEFKIGKVSTVELTRELNAKIYFHGRAAIL